VFVNILLVCKLKISSVRYVTYVQTKVQKCGENHDTFVDH